MAPLCPPVESGGLITHLDVTTMVNKHKRCGMLILHRWTYLVTTLSVTAVLRRPNPWTALKMEHV